jgi:hypothetical protein
VSQVLIQEEMRMKFKDNGSTSIVRADKGKKRQSGKRQDKSSSKSSNDSRKSNDKSKKDIVRHHCGRKGHKKPECWQAHPELKGKSQQSKDQNSKDQKAGGANTLTGQAAPHPNDGGVVGLMAAAATHSRYDDSEVGFVKQPQTGMVNHLQRDDWIIDSGSTEHLVSTPDFYVKGLVRPFRNGIRTATGQLTTSTMSGDVEVFLLQPHGGTRKFTLKDVLFVPEIRINFLGTIGLGKRGIGVDLLLNEVILTHIPTQDTLAMGMSSTISTCYALIIVELQLPAAAATGEESASGKC